MHLALTDLYRAKWTDRIHDEWTRNLLANRKDLSQERLALTRERMNRSVRDALVVGYQHLIPAIGLPDPDDRHVLAAAVQCGAELIITFNKRDFPSEVLDAFRVEAMHPDDFVVDLFDLDSARVLAAVAAHRRSLRHPPKTVAEYLATLASQGLTQTVRILKPYAMAV